MPRSPFVLSSVAAILAACSSSTPAPSGPPPAEYTYSYTTPAGQETHWCQYTKLPKTADGSNLVVTGFNWTVNGLHHVAIYQTTADLPANVDTTTPFDCFAPNGMQYANPGSLFLAGNTSGEQDFPAGTGFQFKSEEIVIVQAHTINPSSMDAHPTLDFKFILGDPAQLQHPLGLIQFYDPYIFVPANGKATAQMRCKIPQDTNVVYATTHQHIRGVGVQSFLDPPDGTMSTTPFITSGNWDVPTTLTNMVTFPAGSAVRTVCSYQGDANDTIQGQDKYTNEMCMFIGYYYPAVTDGTRGFFENCIQTPLPGGIGDMYGTGTKTCGDTLKCVQTCPPGDAPNPGNGKIDVGKCWQQCLVDSCPTASAPFNAMGYCIQTNCATECSSASGNSCATCVIGKCGKEYSTCSSHKCG